MGESAEQVRRQAAIERGERMRTRVDDLHTGHVPTLREWIAEHDISDGFVHCLTDQAMAELLRIADAQEREAASCREDYEHMLSICGQHSRELYEVSKLAQDALKMADALWRLDGTRSELKRLHERARELGIEVEG